MKNIKILLLLAGLWGLFALRADAQAALAFDGTNDFVSLGNPASLQLTTGTVEFMVKSSSSDINDVLCNKSGFYEIYLSNGQLLVWDTQIGVNAVATGISLTNDAWRHVAMTFGPGANNSRIYVDGVLAGTFTLSNALNTGNMNIGTANAPQALAASYDEFRVWNVVRTQAQIQASMNCELLGSETGLAAYYRFNQSSGTNLPDISGNGNNGTLTNFALTGSASNWIATGGVTTGTFCTPGAALAFDGANDQVSVPHNTVFNFTSAMSIEAWIRTSDSGTRYFATKGEDSFYFGINGGATGAPGKLSIFINGVSAAWLHSNATVSDGNWHHVAATYDGSTIRLYVDGTLDNSVARTGNISTGNSSIVLGNRPSILGVFFNGGLDEVRFWSVARTQAQIQQHANCELLGNETGLAAYYRFNQSPGTTLTDATSNANNGTLSNFAFTGSTSNWLTTGGVTSGSTCTAASALAFDGTNDFVSFPAGVYFNVNLTIEAWVFPKSYTDWARILDFGNGPAMNTVHLAMSFETSGKPNFHVEGQQFTSTQTLPLNQWSHVAATLNGSVATIYVNGQAAGTATFNTPPANVTRTNCYIGRSQYAADAYPNANMDEIRIWSVARSQAQIQSAMNCELVGTESGLVAHYKFNQGIVGANNASATTLTDATSNANNGTLTNFTLTGTNSNWVAPGGVTTGTSCVVAVISGSTTGCGSTTLTASGGSSYAWSNSATTAATTITASGTYTVTVTNGGFTATADVNVTINTPPAAPTFSGAATACDSVNLIAAGGTSFAWSNGTATAAATFTASGTYTVTATDANGCTASASQAVTVNTATATLTGPTTGCDEAELTATGGIGYTWTGGGSGSTKAYASPGTYTVTVTDVNGCTASASHTVFIIDQSKTYYPDADGDGYGDSNIATPSCEALAGYILLGADCDDANPLINPGAKETCDNVDNNCNGILIETACGGAGAEVSSACSSRSTVEVLTGKVFFNYGSTTNARNGATRSSHTVGQPAVGLVLGDNLNVGYGFWARFLLAPSEPIVRATEGDLFDRIEIKWYPNPLSPAAAGYNIYRDGSLLATVDNDILTFIDFNVLAGQFYKYEVAGRNQFGEGVRGSAPGFLNPNGVVTGQIKSFSGNPVVGATVKLSPTLGAAVAFNGISTVFTEYVPEYPRENFTLSCWVKQDDGNDGTGIFDFGSSIGKNWWLHTLPAGTTKGVKFGIGKNLSTKTELSFTYPDATKNDWHHVTASYNGSSLLLYVDGELVETAVGEIEADSTAFFIGKHDDEGGYFTGKIDEIRFYDRQLAQTEIQMTMSQTVSASSPGLVSYWKFDEGSGSKAFDLSSRKTKAHLCGATWTTDKPSVVNAGISDATGFYKIEGVNYGPGTTFTAVPSKDFHFNQSLELNGANESYATLTDFDLPDSSTIEITVKNFDFSAVQTLLSKQSGPTTHFSLNLVAGNVLLEMGGTTKNWGALGMGFHRLTFTLKQAGGSVDATFYKDGVLVGTHTFSGVAASFAGGTPWTLGKNAAGNYFTGLIDEVAFFNTLLPLSDIQVHANVGTSVTHPKLSVYFNLNEGEGTVLSDMGTALTGKGATQGATWSTVAAISETLPHEFTPSSRLVTLNPSNTSADQIDFTDQSTIPVSGYVRFENTNCFQKGVEILVNGQSKVPQVLTDADGKFIVDLEPGETVRLTPKFEKKDPQTGDVLYSHGFYPAFWDLQSVSAPVAGILFRNQTKRKVFGQVAGNETCRKSVIPAGAIVKVKVATLNGCYEQVQQLPANGKFTFEGVPPDSVTVAVIEHSNPIIYTFFQNKGGATLDLKERNDTTDFIYLAPPQVEVSPLPVNSCGTPMLEMASQNQVTVKVFEQYDGGVCYLDTALLTINDELSGTPQFDTLMTEGQFKYKFKSGSPNIVPPYLKTLQVTAEAHDELATVTKTAVVLGKRARQTTFASTSPEMPTLILRDPPGDASTAFMESGETTCQNWAYSATNAMNQDEELSLSLGADLTTSVGLGAEVELELDATADFGFQHSGSTSHLTSNELETCITTTKVISTGDNDLVVGSDMGGDVYVGGAVNFIFGITDDLIFDTTTCQYLLDKGLVVFPDGFATTFIYSEYHIQNVVIPNLLTINDPVSAARWQAIIDRNAQLKNEAVFKENISFDGGVTYEQSTTTEVTKAVTNEWVVEFSNGFSTAFGLDINGVGLGAGLAMSWTTTESKTNTNTEATSKTVGFTLADDDIGDNFTVNILQDKAYGTPVFKLISGQSQCPHEPNTQPRESNSLAADATVAVNIPMNDVAVFKLTLGNTSQSEETKFYTLEGLQENNPDGAVIRFNGQPALNVGVPFGQPVEVTMTVARGPSAFAYENLRIGYFSDCEVERADALGIDPPAEQNKEMEFDVYFLEPCSPINVGNPLPDWVHLSTSGTFMNITIDSYDKTDDDLELVRVQYRRSQGDGAWINIAELPKADLGPVFTIVPWDLPTSFKDGFYEIRAVTQCFSGALNPGISKVVKGKLERTPPEIVGTPEPADGVYSAGDEISVTFNEDIRCDQLIQADVFDNNNVGLYDTETGNLVDAVVSCSGDKIVLVPNVPNQFLENKVLRVEVDNIKDLANNTFAHAQWEFVNDRNNLNWLDNVPVYVSKYEEEIKTVTRRLQNRGGFVQDFEITGVPQWAIVFPSSGSLAPGQVQEVTFTFDSTLVFGDYADTVKVEGALGDEPLAVRCRVVCKDPGWAVSPTDWDYSMNFIVQLDIEGTVSDDIEDIVAAYVGTELRGAAKVRYIEAAGKYEAFLTVYSNDFSGETVEFRIWDASECLLYGEVLETFTFEADGLEGLPQAPVVLHTNSQVLREIVLRPGWNWVSFNLTFPDNSVSAALASVNDPGGDLLKSQTQFTQHTAGLGWLGSLTGLGNTSMYQYRTADADTILHIGALIDPTTVNIPVSAGWNWIGYLPQQALTVNEALASLTALNGDIVKSQTDFAVYMAGFGWVGTLAYMSPPNGYLLKMANAGTLTYPNTGNRPLTAGGGRLTVDGATRNPKTTTQNSAWTVNPAQYELSQTMIAMLASDGSNVTQAGFELGAFVNGECRGAATALWVEPLGAHLFFLTVYANTPGEPLVFKYHDGTAVRDLSETLFFSADASVGTVQDPFRFTAGVSSVGPETDAVEPYLGVEPNPVRDGYATVRFRVPESGALRFALTDAAGRTVQQFDYQAQRGMNALMWEGAGRLPQGVYLLKTALPDGTVLAEKVIVK